MQTLKPESLGFSVFEEFVVPKVSNNELVKPLVLKYEMNTKLDVNEEVKV